jgi:hypothetical protein
MANFHQIVDQIRAFVQSSDQTRNTFLEGLASTYAEACVEINQRMGRCHRLLQQGLRSEAIQLAESEPKLLDSLAALDFPERADWDELVQIYELAPAPKLSIEQAQFLNEAYAQEDPLQDLLRMHRRLALQRAPLRSRIGVMRKLAAQDTNNTIWTDDLRTFEKARFRQIQSEAGLAAQSRNVATINQLLAEIEQQTWVEPPPKALVQGLRKADSQFRGQQTRALLTDIDARLNDAFAARDPIRGRIARQEWIAATATAPLDPVDAIWDRVQPPLNWLDEEDRRDEIDHAHEEALSALIHALDDPARIRSAELERRAHAVLQYGRGMSEGIQQRYVSRLRSAEAAQERRWRVTVAGAAAGILLAGSLAFYLIRNWARASDAAQAATAMNGMIELGEVERAGGFLEKLQKADAGLLSFPPMIEARQKFQASQDKETERALQFDMAIREADKVPLNQANSAALESARKLARQETEKQAITQLVQRRAAGLAAERANREKDVGPRLDAVGRKVADVHDKAASPNSGKNDESAIQVTLAEARQELVNLGPHLPFVGDDLQSLATVLGNKIDATQARVDLRRRQKRIEEEITDAVANTSTTGPGKLVNFANGLDVYIKAFPDDPRSVVFRQTRDEQSLWYDVEAWNELAAGWKGQHTGLSSDEAKHRAELCGQFVTRHPGFPGITDIVRYQRNAEAIARRSSLDGSPVTNLRRLLSDIFVNHIWMITIKDESLITGKSTIKRYYTTKQPEESRDYYRFNSIISFDGKELARTMHKDRIIFLGLSPQSKVAALFKAILADESKLVQWETVMIDLADAIRRQPGIDPILQVALLRKVVGTAADGSEPLREALESTKAHLDASTVDVNVPWMNPEDPRLTENRAAAAQVVHELPDLDMARKKALAQRDQIERDAARSYRPVGWLLRNADGWHLRSGVTVPPRGDLWIVALLENKHGEWRKVGAITGGKPKIDATESASLAEGRPVFIITGSL